MSAGRDHDWIEHVVAQVLVADRIGHERYQPLGSEHSGLHGRDRKIRRDRVDLTSHNIGGNGVNCTHARCVLHRNCRYSRGAEDAERVKRLDVSLNARPTTAVAAGYGNRHRNRHRRLR